MDSGIALGFAGNGIAGAAGAIAVRSSALGNKLGNHPVEFQTVIKTFVNQFFKICKRLRRIFFEKLNYNIAIFHFNNCFFQLHPSFHILKHSRPWRLIFLLYHELGILIKKTPHFLQVHGIIHGEGIL